MTSPPFHEDLRSAARWLPKGFSSPLLARILRALPVPSPKLPAGISRAVKPLDAPGTSARIIGAPPDGKPRPALLWIHGGGYIIGAAATDDVLCARFAERLGITVVSVEYRLAPDHPYPAALDDCFAAFDLIHREAAELGIDPARVVIGGASAGGGLAAALALRVHDAGRPAPALQLLVYPMIDDRTVHRDVDGRWHRVWSAASNRLGWSSYLGHEPGIARVPAHAAAARREDLSGLPRAWVGVGDLDLFHDEDVAYAERLRGAGVHTELEIVEGAFHGFDLVLPGKPISQRFFEAQCAAIERALAAHLT